MFKPIVRLLICVCLAIFVSCSSVSNSDPKPDPKPDPDPPATTEPTLSISNPSGGATLSGLITLSASGNKINEVRFFIDDSLLATLSSEPYEKEINTRHFANGDYKIRVEADAAEKDSVLIQSLSVALENYMILWESNNLVASLQEYYDQGYLFISAPNGKVLKEVDLFKKGDGIMKLLPPEELPNGAPAHYNVTTVFYQEADNYLDIVTDTGFEPWASISIDNQSLPSETKPVMRDVFVELSNVSLNPYSMLAFATPYGAKYGYPSKDTLQQTYRFNQKSTDLFISHIPDPYSSASPPSYYWVKNFEGVDTLRYNVEQDFTKMITHSVQTPTDVQINFSNNLIVAGPNTWSEGSVWIPFSYADAKPATPEYDMYIPDLNVDYLTQISAGNPSNFNISYGQITIGDVPDKFKTVNAEITVTDQSLDNTRLNVSGEADYVNLYAISQGGNFFHTWNVFLPDTATSFVYPKIIDHLSQNFIYLDRSNFSLQTVSINDDFGLAGYDEYRNSFYASEDYPSTGLIYTAKYFGRAKRKTAGFDIKRKKDANNKDWRKYSPLRWRMGF